MIRLDVRHTHITGKWFTLDDNPLILLKIEKREKFNRRPKVTHGNRDMVKMGYHFFSFPLCCMYGPSPSDTLAAAPYVKDNIP